jgi:Cof subfamily protein (haloacid dehalogenase superfamily)
MDLSKVFLITDVDGTMLNDEHGISEKNMSAIKEIIDSGGRFTIATGRGVQMASPIVEMLNLKEAAVIFNGAAVYHFGEQKILWQSTLPVFTDYYLKRIMEFAPDAAVEVLCGETVFVPKTNEIENVHIRLGNVNAKFCSYGEIPAEGRLKALVIAEEKTIGNIIKFVKQQGFKGVHWVRSSEHYYEMLPTGVNKGMGFRKLMQLLDLKEYFVAAAGDYNNDIEMLQMADLGVAVENALPEVKHAANLIVSDNNHDAIHEIVEYLKARK